MFTIKVGIYNNQMILSRFQFTNKSALLLQQERNVFCVFFLCVYSELLD